MMPAYRHMEPYVTANDGSPMMNPLRDWRVRKALSLAINREAIRDRIMGGASLPTSNIVPPGFFGYVEELQPDAYDPEAAKALLAEAGYGDGFRMTIMGPNDRYINDARDHRGRGPVLDPDRDHHGSRDHAAQHLLLGPDPGRRGQLPGLRRRRSSPCR